MKGVQCYELFGGIALKIHTFSFFKDEILVLTLIHVFWVFPHALCNALNVIAAT